MMIATVVVLRFIRLDIVLLLAVANSVPVLLSTLFGGRWAAPIDGGLAWRDGRPLLGSHKTWRGLLGGTFASAALGATLSIEPVTAGVVGLLGLVGDLVSSFIKRRAGFHSGQDWPLLDQIPETLFPLVLLYKPLALDLASLGATFGVFVLLAFGAAKVISYRRAPTSHRSDG
jgi:CDP-2,3-bis-(O-geranylgeranyl)-sn-glycerol synthase